MSNDERIEEANNAVLEKRKNVDKEFYPWFHIAPYASSLGPPGGLAFFKGLYHVFYQQNPFRTEWGPMHWAHASSEDMVHWRHHPIALAPGDDWDRDGCLSGSSVVFNEKLYVFYTGHHWLSDVADDSQIYQVQCLAVSENGYNFEKRGIVVKPPSGFTHFRDPKVWFEEDRWWMVCGGRDSKDQGQLLLYSTDDLEDWDDSTYMILAKSEDRNVYMWECPDFFPMGGQSVLMFSPQGLKAEEYTYRNRYQSGILMGQWKAKQPFCASSKFKEIDLGHDFYAPQSFLTPDGRRVVIGWMDMWDTNMPTREHHWCGVLTIPRVLFLDSKTGILRTQPIKELEGIRRGYRCLHAQVLSDNTQLSLIKDCSACELRILFDTEKSNGEKYGILLGKGFEIYVDSQSSRLVVNRHYPKFSISGYRSYSLPSRPTLLLHIFFDRSSAEIFVNEGEAVLSTRIYPSQQDRILSLFCVSGVAHILRGDIWLLERPVLQ